MTSNLIPATEVINRIGAKPKSAALGEKLPILMKRDEVINLKRALAVSGKSPATLRRWCNDHGISRQSKWNAPLEISWPALVMVLHGDFAALELLRGGRRDHPLVRRYFDFIGLPLDGKPDD